MLAVSQHVAVQARTFEGLRHIAHFQGVGGALFALPAQRCFFVIGRFWQGGKLNSRSQGVHKQRVAEAGCVARGILRRNRVIVVAFRQLELEAGLGGLIRLAVDFDDVGSLGFALPAQGDIRQGVLALAFLDAHLAGRERRRGEVHRHLALGAALVACQVYGVDGVAVLAVSQHVAVQARTLEGLRHLAYFQGVGDALFALPAQGGVFVVGRFRKGGKLNSRGKGIHQERLADSAHVAGSIHSLNGVCVAAFSQLELEAGLGGLICLAVDINNVAGIGFALPAQGDICQGILALAFLDAHLAEFERRADGVHVKANLCFGDIACFICGNEGAAVLAIAELDGAAGFFSAVEDILAGLEREGGPFTALPADGCSGVGIGGDGFQRHDGGCGVKADGAALLHQIAVFIFCAQGVFQRSIRQDARPRGFGAQLVGLAVDLQLVACTRQGIPCECNRCLAVGGLGDAVLGNHGSAGEGGALHGASTCGINGNDGIVMLASRYGEGAAGSRAGVFFLAINEERVGGVAPRARPAEGDGGLAFLGPVDFGCQELQRLGSRDFLEAEGVDTLDEDIAIRISNAKENIAHCALGGIKGA